VAQTWFWLSGTTVSNGSSPPAGATIIGYVDTTNTSGKISRIRQIQFGDVEASSAAISYTAYNNSNSYQPGQFVYQNTQITVGGVTVAPGRYACLVAVPASGGGNYVPQFPLPTSGTIYWDCLALGPGLVNVCSNLGGAQIGGNFSSTF
jgi:hypothetical protein